MKQSEYWAEVKNLAEIYYDSNHPDRSGQDADEWLWETCDGHEFVIYTYKARKVLEYSNNDQAYLDEGLGDVIDWNRPEPAAMAALVADVREQ